MDQNICLNCGTPLDRPNSPCPFCGAPEMKSYTPKLHSLLSSAFSLLRESQFDKAKTAFEAILKKDCESVPAYWGRLRARYHISYVRTVEGKMIPRSATRSAAKLAEDIDYRRAMLYADEETKSFLQAQAEYLHAFCTAPDVGASKNITHQFTMGEVDQNDGMTGKSDNPRYTLKIKKYSDGTYGVAGIKLLDKTVTRVVIPYACDGKAVTVVHQEAFRNQKNLTEIVVPDCVTVIGNAAFQGCDSLEKLTLPFIGYSATEAIDVHFGYVFGAPNGPEQSPYIPKSLKTVVITGGNTISTSAFNGCKNLTSIEISDGVTSIGISAFNGCENLTGIAIPKSVKSIGNYAFCDCKSLTGITVPDGVTSIAEGVFEDCGSLTGVEIPRSVTSIGDHAFKGCRSLTDIAIPDGVTSIGFEAFKGCASLESLTLPFVGNTKDGYSNSHFGYIFGAKKASELSAHIPTSLKTVVVTGSANIRSSAFYSCGNLKSIIIPGSVKNIGESAFNGCKNLTSITISEGVTSIGDYAFNGCSGLTGIKFPKSLKNIGHAAFISCSSLKSISIPNSVNSIGSETFSYCSRLTEISVHENNAYYCSENGVLFNKAKTKLICYPMGKTETAYSIPDSVTSIGDYAFYKCGGLTSISIPDGVNSIGDYAFHGCFRLTSITIPEGVTSIGDYMFYGCSSLTSISIPESVTSIGSSAFRDCNRLTGITIPHSVTGIDSYAFDGCRSLKNLIFTGTKSQWKAIKRAYSWNDNTGPYIVICTDGTLFKSES